MALAERSQALGPSARATAALRILGRAVAARENVGTPGPCHVAAFIGYPTAGRADPSNAAPTVKALIDGITDAGVWPDDDHTYVIGPRGVIFAELKTNSGRIAPEQRAWLEALHAAGVHAYVWRPVDWPQVKAILDRLAGRRP